MRYQYGMAIDAGQFDIQADVITTQSSYTAVLEQFRFALEADVLRLQDAYGALYLYQRRQ